MQDFVRDGSYVAGPDVYASPPPYLTMFLPGPPLTVAPVPVSVRLGCSGKSL